LFGVVVEVGTSLQMEHIYGRCLRQSLEEVKGVKEWKISCDDKKSHYF
jgi:hypothetical protein